MIELNNLAVSELPQVMREETLMEGYWSLVRDAAAYCAELHNAGVRCSVDVFEVAADAERMKAIVAETMSPETTYLVSIDCFPIIVSNPYLSEKSKMQTLATSGHSNPEG